MLRLWSNTERHGRALPSNSEVDAQTKADRKGETRMGQAINGQGAKQIGVAAKKDFSRKHIHTKNKIKLDLTKKGNRFALVVAVYSTHKHGLKATNSINPGKADSQKNLQHRVEVAAGACGEHLCENYGDTLDPDRCAQAAREAFYELFKKIASTGKDVGSITAQY